MSGVKQWRFVSVIIPVYNAEETIERCLTSILDLNYPKDMFEIVVINDGSVDRTLEILRKFSGKVRIMSKKRGGAASAQNVGIRNTNGEIILNVDSDTYVTKNYLNAVIEEFDEPQVGIVAGFMRTAPTRSFWGRITGYEAEERGLKKIASKYVHHMTTSCTAYRRIMFDDIGYFDESLKVGGYDTEFSKRAIKAGWKIVLVNSIWYHEWKTSFSSYFKQQVRGGSAITRVFRKHPDVIKGDEVIRTKYYLPAVFLTVLTFIWPLFLALFCFSYIFLFWIPYVVLVLYHVPHAVRILRSSRDPQMALFPFVIISKYVGWLVGIADAIVDLHIRKRQ